MTFSSILFLFFFLPAALLFCRYDVFIPPSVKRRMSVQTKKKHFKIENLFILIFSLFFYGWGEPKYIVIMIFTILLNYICALLIHSNRTKGKQGAAKAVLVISVILNLGILGFFKYFNFFLTNINNIFGLDIQFLKLALPIGISFYTFQTMSYTIDVYRNDAKVQKNIINLAAYVTMFPQLIAGPIVRYQDVAEQLEYRDGTAEKFAQGVQRFCIGLGKKVLLANNIGALWDTVKVMENPTVLSAWLGAFAFMFQIYFDFSGYSDMAIGMGKMLGFEFLENFNYPYMARSVTDFWRRWHISLGTWFREYVYIPLGGNRKGTARQILNLLIVWGLTGFWHGASWNFLCWGLYFGIILIIEKTFLLKRLQKAPWFVGSVYTLLLVIFSWIIFAVEDFTQIPVYLGSMFGVNTSLYDSNALYLLISNAILFVILIPAATNLPARLMKKIFPSEDKAVAVQTVVKNVFCIALLILSVASLVSDSYNPFLYFRF